MKHIDSKQDFYKLSRKLLLGNILRQWTWEQFVELYLKTPDYLPKVVGVRHVRRAFTNKGASGLMKRDDAYNYGHRTPDKENLLFDEGAVHDKLTIQGELLADNQGLYVRYSTLQCHQRTLWHIDQYGVTGLRPEQMPHNLATLTPAQIAGQSPVVKHATGLQASALLQKHMDASTWDCVNDILREFHYPVVEFACFSRPVGVLGWNSVIWEVRTRY